jgi:glycosyltransferase involved in cell wall biosynthesis
MLRIDYLSPLPPTRTGIADYSADLLPALARRCQLRVVALPGQDVGAAMVERWQPLAFEPWLAAASAAADAGTPAPLPLYQMGNNQMHHAIWKAALRVPGVMVLHDLVLHHFHLGRTLGLGSFPEYSAQLAADHGWVGERVAAPARWGAVGNAGQFALPARRTLLERQRGVLVHSRWAAAELREEEPGWAVREIPMPVPLPPPADRAAGLELRRRLGIPDAAPVLGSFGFQTPMKRTHVVVKALTDPRLAGAHLLVAGEVSPYVNLAGLVAKLGVADRVHLMGYLPFAGLEQAIAAADLCVNLRYPTAGETSASLLRILALGCPAVVSDYAQFRDLPDDAVLKVPIADGDEAAAMAEKLAELLAGPEALRRLGETARAHVAREHDPERAAAALATACGELASLPPPAPRAAAPPRPTSLTWSAMPGRLEVEGATNWEPGERRTLRFRLHNDSRARWLAADRGQGGLALRVEVEGPRAESVGGLHWLPLPHDLLPGDDHTFALPLRRPLGPTLLRVVPRLLEMGDLPRFGGPYWEGEV